MKQPDKVLIKELKEFANSNGIECTKCDKNALKVKKQYGGAIHDGSASYYNFNKKQVEHTEGHVWNVIEYIDEFGIKEQQIIDIYNYTKNPEVIYFGYAGAKGHFNKLDCNS